MSMLRFVAWGVVDTDSLAPNDIEKWLPIEDAVMAELAPTPLRIWLRRYSVCSLQWVLWEAGARSLCIKDGTFRECCKAAVDILDAL